MNKITKKKIVILTGAGMDAESGVATFRDSNGLWEDHKVEDVASPKGWLANPQLVLDFYNQRRQQIGAAEPNAGHKEFSRLNDKYDVRIITQNISDLQERAGSENVLHLHGIITKARSCGNENNIKTIGYEDMKLGDFCEENFQMRPHIVWFGEAVPMIGEAEDLCREADIIIIVGTSMKVYPAAGLYRHSKSYTPIFYVDNNPTTIKSLARAEFITTISEEATTGIKKVIDLLLADEYKLPIEIHQETAPEIPGEIDSNSSESTS